MRNALGRGLWIHDKDRKWGTSASIGGGLGERKLAKRPVPIACRKAGRGTYWWTPCGKADRERCSSLDGGENLPSTLSLAANKERMVKQERLTKCNAHCSR